CPLPKSHPRRMPVPVGCGRPKHQEDRNGPDKTTKTGHGVSRNLSSPSAKTQPAKNPIAKKAKPAEKIDGFVSSLWAPSAPFFVSAAGKPSQTFSILNPPRRTGWLRRTGTSVSCLSSP
ncbi:hypothetical protein, partial [Rhizobium fabae]|uniref:hypothetical protein n=1 Tax=Rhizobium fabae TaxID=573179 RepID=UPI001AEED478